MSKMKKKTKICGHDFLTYLLENEPRTYFEAMLCLKASYLKRRSIAELNSL